MAHFKNLNKTVHEGKTIIRDGIVEKIVSLAASDVPYVKPYAGFFPGLFKDRYAKVSYEKDGVHVDVSVSIHYSQSISEIAFRIQESIRHNIEAMTDYKIACVNVFVKSVYFDDEKDKDNEDNKEKDSKESN